jgi:hypothetical protein
VFATATAPRTASVAPVWESGRIRAEDDVRIQQREERLELAAA